ncbi:MAG: hypothetical protein EOO75_12645, partial [Myxococcales bacterium]
AAAAALNPSTGYVYRPLRTRVMPWAVDEALDEICAIALDPSPDGRFATAGALAHAVEQVLEGTQERERRQRRADDLIATAELLHGSYDDLMAERPQHIERYLTLRDQVAPWEGEERKQPLWDAEEQTAVMGALAVRTMQEVISTYEQALDEVPGLEAARSGLERLYTSELRRAEDRRDSFGRAYFDEKLRHSAGDQSRSRARLEITTGEVEADVMLLRFVEEKRRLVARQDRWLGRTPLADVSIDPGSYLLRLRRSSFEVNYPLLVRPGDDLEVQIDMLVGTELADDEVLIPAGPSLIGGDDDLPPREITIPAFLLMREPVTFEQYLPFLLEAYRSQPALAEGYLPLSDEGNPYWTWTGQRFRPGKILRWGDDPQRLLKLPVVGIDAWAARAFATWRTRRTGRIYRLPNEHEWEKAARGVDGRRYPWGDTFDASFCKMRESRALVPSPEPPGAFETDVSVYGVRDMAGGIADWVMPVRNDATTLDDELSRLVSRGGAFSDPPHDCRLSSRRLYLALDHSSRLGLRLARTPTGRALASQIAPRSNRNSSEPPSLGVRPTERPPS